MNQAIITGRVCGDIVVRTANNKPVTSFTVAVDSYKDHTDFINCVAWDKKAELLEKFVKKGDKIGLCGRISARSFDDKDGKKQYVTEVVVTDIEFLQPKAKEAKPETKPEDYDMFIPF